jgi:tetraacyldisaccharide 4'-kinase
MRAPTFWKEKTPLSSALLPLSLVYGWLAKNRQCHAQSAKLSVPVICVGNLVAGGAGKTPVALKIGALLKARNIHAHYLSRGYKGSLPGPVQVNPAVHNAQDVGDEPLLLSAVLPTWVAADRVAGANAAIAAGAQLILMDDGFQNPLLQKDVSLLVIDGRYGLGNERIMPAGPLREPIVLAMRRASAVVIVGDDVHQVKRHVPKGKPVLRMHTEPKLEAGALDGKSIVAFAGIAHPRKFYRTLQAMGHQPKKMVAYPDHYVFKAKDIAFLREKAKEQESILVTTMKDYVRLPADMQREVTAVPIEAVFEDETALLKVLLP